MKRYFDLTGKRITLELEVNEEGQKYTVKQLSENFNTDLAEIDKAEYNKLTREYGK